MNESHITGFIASVLQFVVAGYALRLNRRYGTSRVGWSLFGAFALLALLQLIQASAQFPSGTHAAVEINVTYALISFLLLIGMVHLEATLKEKLRREGLERELRAQLEIEVKSKTAHLTRAIEELMAEVEENKRMGAIIETSHWVKAGAVVKDLVPDIQSESTDDVEQEHMLGGILGAELLAHF
jgi:hypothetical protein